MGGPVVVGRGTIVGLAGDLWAVKTGPVKVYIVYIAQANMLAPDPKAGDVGVLTYEYRGISRQACFRALDDPVVQGRG